ncbi:MAG: murein biosynthesis integral membrane protein MurJ [Verrucomicrobiales bacterium]|nr:murein biosynthesis integral membrane protein MurJ [Verrucomicrobiales bacterium]
MLKSSGAMGAATLASRILGMVREILYARFMGDTPIAGAFVMAFMIPNLFRRLLGEGALTAAFIPIFKAKERTQGEAEMWRAANATICGLVISASVVIAVVWIGFSLLLYVDAPPGFQGVRSANTPEVLQESFHPHFPEPGFLSPNTRLMLELARVMFPYMLLVCLAALFMGILNARGHFFVPAMGAVMLNVVMILAVVFLAPRFGATLDHQVFALAFGVLVAGFAQMIYQWPTLRREGYRWQWVPPWGNETVREVVFKMVPGMMGVAAFQVNMLVTQSIAFAIDPQIVASFTYAVRLMELPQGIFGVSLATYLLPTLAGLASERKFPEFRSTLGQGLGYLTFTNLIASVLLVILAEPIVRLLFERGEFTALSTRRAALAVACLAPGLIAFSIVNILARAFYALGDTRTPMLISSVCFVLNIVFTFGLVPVFRQGGMGLANTVSAICNMVLLFYALRRKMKHLNLALLKRTAWSLAGASIVAGEIAWLASAKFWERWIGHTDSLEKLGAVFVPAALAGLAYWTILLWLKVPQAWDVLHLLRRKVVSGKTR